MTMDIERVEWYAGYCGQEKPVAVWAAGNRFQVVEVIWQKRIRDRKSGRTREVFFCRLESGQRVKIEKMMATGPDKA